MDFNRALTGIILLLCVITGFSLVAPDELQTHNAAAVASSSVMAVHTYENGVHTYNGIIDLPSPCFSLTTDIHRTSDANTATLSFQSQPSNERGQCIEVVDPRPFSVRFSSDSKVDVQATMNGTSVPIRIISTSTPDFLSSRLFTDTNATTSTNHE